MKKNILLLFFILNIFSLHCLGSINDKIADRLVELLIKSYGEIDNLNLIEKIVIDLGRGAFEDNVRIWRNNYQDINGINIRLHSQFIRMADRVRKYGRENDALMLEECLRELTFLGYKNIDYYYRALLLSDKDFSDADFTIEDVDYAVSNPLFYDLKLDLYERERILKEEIRGIISSEHLKSKMRFYITVFDFLNKIRDKIIEADLEKTQKK